ncbi:hypothetical protein Tco_0551870 [Tanacetum coccineum]
MHQFWYSIKKVQGTDSYEFLLANKKCVVNADVFKIILDICPRVEGVKFTDVPDDDTTLAFLIKLGYKGPLYKHTNMFVDHMHQPRRTLAAIINKCLSGKITSNDKLYDGIVCRLKFVKISEDYQEYRLSIPETMLTEEIKQSESYQMFIKYSTGQIRPKKSRGKGSQRKKTDDDSQETIDVSKESKPELEPVKRKTSCKRRVKKKVTLSANDNIISDDPDTALKLGKSISQIEAEEAEAARQLKDVPSLTPEEQEAADIMPALKESKKTSKRQPGTKGSSEGTGTKPGVPDESTVVFATSSKGTEQESEHFEEDKLDDEENDEKEGDADDEDDEAESDENDIYKYKICVCKDEDEEMINTEVDDYDKGDEEVTDAAKADAEKTLEVKDDPKKTELLSTSSSLSISSGFGDQFLKLSSDSSLVSNVKDTVDAGVSSLMDIPIQQETPHIESPSVQKVLVSVIPETINLPPILEILTETLVSTVVSLPQVTHIISSVQQTTTPIPTLTITTEAPIITTAVSESDALSIVQLRVAKLEKDVSDLKKIYLSAKARVALKTIDLDQGSEKSTLEILKIKREQAEKQQTPKFTIKSTDQEALNEYDQKSTLYQTMHAN